MLDEVDIDFNNSLLYIYIEIREMLSRNDNKDLNTSIESSKLIMRKMADSFYEKFRSTKIPVIKPQAIYEKFNSVGIVFEDGSGFAVPYFFYQQMSTNLSLDFSDIFAKNLPWLDLLSEIFEKTNSLKCNITKVDIKILRALCFYKRNSLFSKLDFAEQKNFLFQIKTLSEIINQSYRWTIARINYLINNYMLALSYILNPFLFGLKTYLINYESSYDDKIAFLNPITLFKLIVSYNEVLRVIQLPNIQSSTELQLEIPHTITNLSEMHIFNNLSDLSEDPKKSFVHVPKFENTTEIISKPIIEFKEQSISQAINLTAVNEELYPLLNKMSNERRISIIVRVLNYLAKWGSIQGNLKKASKNLRVNALEFLETCKFLFNNDIIAFFPRLSRIGCDNRYGIIIKDELGNNSEDITKIYYNLLELPLSAIFLGENILFAYVAMPDSYLPSFLKYINSLSYKFNIKYSPFIALKSWGRFSIPLPEGTTVDEYGVNFPYNVIEKLKIKA